jgi:hypothetical protein
MGKILKHAKWFAIDFMMPVVGLVWLALWIISYLR